MSLLAVFVGRRGVLLRLVMLAVFVVVGGLQMVVGGGLVLGGGLVMVFSRSVLVLAGHRSLLLGG